MALFRIIRNYLFNLFQSGHHQASEYPVIRPRWPSTKATSWVLASSRSY